MRQVGRQHLVGGQVQHQLLGARDLHPGGHEGFSNRVNKLWRTRPEFGCLAVLPPARPKNAQQGGLVCALKSDSWTEHIASSFATRMITPCEGEGSVLGEPPCRACVKCSTGGARALGP